jgi:hypothetical protein
MLRIADDAGFVNIFAGDAKTRRCRLRILLRNARKVIANAGDFRRAADLVPAA